MKRSSHWDCGGRFQRKERRLATEKSDAGKKPKERQKLVVNAKDQRKGEGEKKEMLRGSGRFCHRAGALYWGDSAC